MVVVVSRAIVCNLHAHSTMVVGEGRKENVKEMRLAAPGEVENKAPSFTTELEVTKRICVQADEP